MAATFSVGYSFGSTELVTNTKLGLLVSNASVTGIVSTEIADWQSAVTLLSSTTVSLAADADTTLYTVPTSKVCVLSHAILVVGANAAATDISIGANGTETDFVPATDLGLLDAANDACKLEPIMTTNVPKIEAYAAATVIEAKVTNQAGGATNTLFLFGFLYNA